MAAGGAADGPAAGSASGGLAARYVRFLARHHLLIAIAAFLVFLGGVAAALRLELHADLAELLPQHEPAVEELHQIADTVGTPLTLVVAVEGQDPAANRRFADALARRLQPLVGGLLRGLDYRSDAAKSFYEHNQALYAGLDDLRRIDEDLEQLVLAKKNPAFVSVDDPRADLTALRRELEQRARKADRFPSGYFEGEDGHLLALIGWTVSSGTGDASGFAVRDAVARAIAATGPASFGVTASITGEVESAIQEHESLKSDVELVSALCTVLVLLVIVAYFRSLLAIPYIFFPTLLGVALAFGTTGLAIGYLNTNTAFLGSIILGNGINFGIILLARYQEERAGPGDVQAALTRAIQRTARPTLVAALAAAIAYGSLGVTRFRGFQQFGFVGGIGMILCWLATYSHCPALILLGERWSKRRSRPRRRGALALPVARRLLAHPRTLLGVTGVLTVLALVSIGRVAGSPFDYDFRRLRNQASVKHGAGQMYGRVGRIFDSDISPIGVALLPSAAEAPLLRPALLERDCAEAEAHARTPLARDPARLAAECARRVAAGEPSVGMLQDVRTADSLLPRDQDEKLAIVAHLRQTLSQETLALLDDEDCKQVDEWLPPADLHRLGIADLPEALARPYRELDGRLGRVALVYPVPGRFHNWDGHVLLRLSDFTHGIVLPTGTRANVAGRASVFAAMLRSIVRDGTLTSLAAFLGVVLLVILFFRERRGILLVVGGLCLGVVWMAGAGALWGLRLNFLNFVVVPVTLGIGVDYAVNIYARLSRERTAEALAETGSAVALCSATTIIGYSTLLIADSGALRSFGKLAVLGEVGCLVAALLVVPALLARSRACSVDRVPSPG